MLNLYLASNTHTHTHTHTHTGESNLKMYKPNDRHYLVLQSEDLVTYASDLLLL